MSPMRMKLGQGALLAALGEPARRRRLRGSAIVCVFSLVRGRSSLAGGDAAR